MVAKRPLERLVPSVRVALTQLNPKRAGSKVFERYERYKLATTVEEALRFGASIGDLEWDRARGYLRVVSSGPSPAPASSDEVAGARRHSTAADPSRRIVSE
eukprot:TRINITY_DN3857_c0_g1_i2.p3 TRINITY_DN3857_c0_g1~~TRINITY_DN3857_c0_g1_i2.p3  ORF type:complete len:119 (-),score=17.57 TRINITY_DN3857_c0_g1_i2:790-1095(-)